MPRFAILEHTGTAHYKPGVHYDLLFELGATLQAWATQALPSEDRSIACQRLPDHRPVYLEFEGELSRDRGRVKSIDRGACRIDVRSADHQVIYVHGDHYDGRFEWSRTDEPESWSIRFIPNTASTPQAPQDARN